jgi:apolipoprotein N-acyltransferase
MKFYPKRSFFIAVIGGFVFSLSHPHYLLQYGSLWPLSMLGLLIFLTLLPKTFFKTTTPSFYYTKMMFLPWLLFSLTITISGFYWLPETLRVFGGLDFPFHYLLSSLFAFIAFPQLILFFLFFDLLPQRAPFRGVYAPLTWSILLTMLEPWVPQLFPVHLGHSWMGLRPFLGMAPMGGVPLFSFMSYYFVFSLLFFFHGQRRQVVLSASIFSLFCLLNIAFPLPSLSTPPRSLKVRIVQPNVGNFLKMDFEQSGAASVKRLLEYYTRLSTQKGSQPNWVPDLIVWPETAYPYALDFGKIQQTSSYLPLVFRDIKTHFPQVEILFGTYELNRQSLINQPYSSFENVYNSAMWINQQGQLNQVYRKQRLIPFGETLPLGPLNRLLAPYIQHLSFFSKGDRFTLFETANHAYFSVAICYELLYSQDIKKLFKDLSRPPHFLINVTNDSWYGKTAEPFQHLFLAKWRALEFQIPIVRSTNTGISLMIYPNGEESHVLKTDQEGILDLQVPLIDHQQTMYEKWGQAVFLLWAFLLYLLTYFFQHLGLLSPDHKHE